MKQILLSALIPLVLTSCGQIDSKTTGSELIPQRTNFDTQPDFVKSKKDLDKENRKQFILGAIKLCSGEDYESVLGSGNATSGEAMVQRTHAAFNADNSWCYSYFTMSNMINPYEYYLFVIEDNQEIFRNQSNPFKLKEIRESSNYLSNVNRITEAAGATNPLLLKHYSMDAILQEYDFSKGEQKIDFQPYMNNGGMSMNPNKKLPGTFNLIVEESNAKKVFEFYQSGKPTKENGYTKGFHRGFNTVNAVVTYELHPPTRKRARNFEAIPVKVEFFDHKGWDNKLAEYYYK